MKIANEITRQGTSSKRLTQWNGMCVGFNKARTTFFKIEDFGPHDGNGGHIGFVRILELDSMERVSLLATWRVGKAAWYVNHAGLPLRRAASRARRAAIAETN
jgi:hypothetical protein